MKAPAFQFYARDFRASLSVAVMSSAQRGGYIMLLAAAWDYGRPGYLPNDDDLLRLFSGMTEDEWTAGRERILKQFPETEDKSLRFNARLLAEVEKQANYRESRAKGGKAAAEKRAAAQHKPSSESAYDENNPSHADSDPSIADALLSASASSSENKKASKQREQGLASPSSQSQPQANHEGPPPAAPGKPREYHYDEAPCFQRKAFFALLDTLLYGHVDKGRYLLKITRGADAAVQAKKIKALATDREWESYIERWLDNDRANKCLILPEGAERGEGLPRPNQNLQLVTSTSYDPAAIAARQADPIY